MPTISPDELRQVMRHWITGVTIVTCSDGSKQHGITVNSFNSLSLDPPLISIALNRGVRTQRLIEKMAVFGVSILGADQAAISDRFAGKIPETEDRFAGESWFRLVSTAPLLSSALAALDCSVIYAYESKSSIVYIAEVVAGQILRDDRPLIYHNRTYHQLKD